MIHFLSLIPAALLAAVSPGIGGRVIDNKDRNPLEYATVALRQVSDSSVVSGATTDKNGAFNLKASDGEYILEVSFIGYKTWSSRVKAPAEVEVVLEEDVNMLQAGKVTANVRLVEMKMDKVVMNVSQSAFAQSSNGLELLKKAPGVTVDKDGNIQVNGKSVSVWIDGRPSQLDGKSLNELLKSTSGDSIDQFEIMEHPSAKYDAAGQGGIINIKTKKNFAQGLTGSLGLNVGGMYYGGDVLRFIPDESSWVNVAWRGKKTNTFVNLYQTYYDFAMNYSNETDQTVEEKILSMKASSIQNFNGNYWNAKVGNDWFIDDKNTLGFIVTVPGAINKGFSDPSHNTSERSWDGVVFERTVSDNKNTEKMIRTTANLNYTHIFDPKKASEITVNLDWYRNSSPSFNRQDNTISETGEETFRSSNTENIVSIWSAKADFQTMFWKTGMLEAGAKWSMSTTDHNNLREESYITPVNTVFTYREHIAALYVSAAKQFSQKWSAKLGLRGEYTNTLGQWKTSGKPDTRRSYFDLFPTAFVGYTHSENFNLSLSYTRRIQRPHYNALNPTESFIDAHTIVKGNPDILPAFSDGVRVSTSFYKYFSFSSGYNFTSDMMMELPSVTETGDQVLTYGNFGQNHNASLSFSMSSYPIAKWLDWTVNLTGLYSNNIVKGNNFSNSGFSFFGYTCLTFNLPKDWKIEVDGNYSSPMHWGNFVMGQRWTCNAGVKKTLLDGKLTLNFNVDDIFRSSNTNMQVIGLPGVKSIIIQNYCNQTVKVGLVWNFGKNKQPVRYRKVGGLEEDSRVGGGQGNGGAGTGIGR